MADYAFFLGCNIPNRLPHLELAARKVLPKFDVNLVDIPEFGCCPEPIGIQELNRDAWMAMAAINLCLAEEKGLDIIACCNGCFETLKTVNTELQHDTHHKEKVNSVLAKIGKEFKGNIKVKHILEVLYNDIGLDKIKASVTKELKGVKVAVHYGCHVLRPSAILKVDDPFQPKSLDELVNALGAESIPYLRKMLCCGTGIEGVDKENQLWMVYDKLTQVERMKADCMTMLCPLCYIQYEMGQLQLKKEPYNAQFKIPVMYYPELLGLAIGMEPSELGFKLHRVKVDPVLQKIQ
ncbi:MAG: CoB--CoM heterodisulfide reductase iron-sulfur subunit B family protein [Candidatus Helarchaeota archaeon]